MSRLNIAIVALVVGFTAYDFINDAERDESGTIVSGGEVSVFSMRVGDCFDDSQEILDAGPDGVELEDLGGRPCSEPHDNEVYAVFDVALETFPGAEAISDMAADECLARFDRWVGLAYEESILDILPIYPTVESWSQKNDREIVCALYHIELEKLTGSMKGSGV